MQLVEKLVRLHRLTVQTPELQPAAYLRQLADDVPVAVRKQLDPVVMLKLLQAAEKFEGVPGDIVLCHMDLHSGNILLQQQRIWLIDFEYCQRADSSFDLAALSLNLQMNASEEQAMLAYYLQYRPQASVGLAGRLTLAKQLYSGFCWLWYLSLPDSDEKAMQALHKLRQLQMPLPQS